MNHKDQLYTLYTLPSKLLLLVFLIVLPQWLPAQLEIEASIGNDFSKFHDLIDKDNLDLGIQEQLGLDNSFGFTINFYSKINPKTRLGIGIAGFSSKEILLLDYSPNLIPREKVRFQDLRFNLGLKQTIWRNYFFKLNVGLHSVHKPTLFLSAIEERQGSLSGRRVFIGPELRLCYTFKNIFIEFYGFKNIRAFADPDPPRNWNFNVNSINKDFSFGINIGYTLYFPSIKSIERKVQERMN